MKRSEAFPSKYLSKDDVDTPRLGTIARLTREVLKSDDGDETKTVMYFTEEVLKPLILNNTNWMTCEDAYGPDSDMWLGKKIELFHDPTVMFGAKRVGGVRVRVPTNHAKTYSKDEAIAALEAVGLDKSALAEKLTAAGRVKDGKPVYTAATDSALVDELLAQAQPF